MPAIPAPDALAMPPFPGAVPGDDLHRPCPVDTAEESVAGEEDPGAALDLDQDLGLDLPEAPAAAAPAAPRGGPDRHRGPGG